jgi:acetolactate synthase-1/2/3 large subunit
VRDLALTMKKAFHIARTGRPGPVVVDIPKDVSLKTAPFHYPERVEMRSYNPVRKGHGGQIRKAVQLLMQARRPYIYTGGGVILGNASAELRELADLLGFPCTNTLMGLGAIASGDPKFLGMLGMHGTYEANMTMQHCDVLLAVGARFDDRVIGNPKHFASVERKIIHVDIDPSSISKRVKVDIPIVGDVKDVLQELIAQIKEAQSKPDKAAINAWWSQVNEWRKRDCLAYKKSSEVIKPQYVVDTLWQLTKDRDTYITSDVGQHQMWAAQFYRFREPRAAWARWASACRTRWASSSPSRSRTCSASPAKARSRCASRSSRPASSTRRRSRSSRSTTATSAWCGSGRNWTTAGATRTATWTRCPTS